MVFEILRIDLIEQREILHVFQETGGLYHVSQCQVGRLQDGDDIFQCLNSLSGHAVGQCTRIGDDSQLARGEDEPIGFDGLRIGANRSRRFVSV